MSDSDRFVAVPAERQGAPWPAGVRCAILLGMDIDGPSHETGRGLAPLGVDSWGRYSARRGVPRYLDIFERHGARATVFVPGYDAQCHPGMVRDIDAAGQEVAAHGYLHEAWELQPDEERELLVRTHHILADLLGRAPLGWRSPSGRKTDHTLQVLSELGYRFDSSDKDYDMPYVLRFGAAQSGHIIEFPNNTYSLNDTPFYRVSMTPASDVLVQWKAEFDLAYRTGGMFILTFHPRSGWGSGTPSRARMIEQLIMYINGHAGVRYFRMGELADWFNANPGLIEEFSL